MKKVTVLDYGSGNVFSLVNALKFVGFSVHLIKSGEEISRAENLVLPWCWGICKLHGSFV